MTAILGISAYYHDSAAALIVDGRVVAAAQQERFSRKKHDERFPTDAVDYCLKEAGVAAEDIDFVVFYDKPFLKFERLLETYLNFAPAGFRSFFKAMPLWLKKKLHLPREMRRALGGKYKKRFLFPSHHESHAASAFFPSPFDEAAILTLDGVGEWATGSVGIGRGNKIHLLRQMNFPHSLGLLYSAFTYFCGFRVNSGEYKLMGLAPYGRPRYVDPILEKLLDLKEDGSLRLDLSYFNYCHKLRMTSPRFDKLFGGPPRSPESPITEREMDLAASIQQVTEEVVMRQARFAHELTGCENLCLAGGVSLNCVANGRLLREGPFRRIWIQPAAGDAGGALGAAWLAWHQLLDRPRQAKSPDGQQGSLLGPAFSNEQIELFLQSVGACWERVDDVDLLCRRVASLIAEEKVVGWMQGRMEFGPRALGSRSILGDARSPKMQTVMNLKIKFRESFRPFAPIVLREKASQYFDLPQDVDSPYMLLVAQVAAEKQGKKVGVDEEEDASDLSDMERALRRLARVGGEIPAITHVDGSARVQTVDAGRSPRVHRLLSEFESLTGCPVMINTSFNVRGEPIVCAPEDAYRCFMGTNMDVLVMENCILLKSEQADAKQYQVDEYLARFQLD